MYSYQLYSSRNFGPLADTLKMLAAVGYKDTEGFGGLYSDGAKLAELTEGLKANGLTMSTGHFGLDLIEQNPDFVIKVAHAVGMKKVYCPHIGAADRPTDGKGWRKFGKPGLRLLRTRLGFFDLRAGGFDFGSAGGKFCGGLGGLELGNAGLVL